MIEIKKLSKQDALCISLIENDCFAHPWSQKAVEDSFDNNTIFFGAVSNQKIVGYCGMQTVLDEGFITNVAVLQSYRKQGAGDALIKALLQFANEQNLSSVSLEVRVSNQAAISLYEKNGFINLGTRKNFYRDPAEDAYIMTRQM